MNKYLEYGIIGIICVMIVWGGIYLLLDLNLEINQYDLEIEKKNMDFEDFTIDIYEEEAAICAFNYYLYENDYSKAVSEFETFYSPVEIDIYKEKIIEYEEILEKVSAYDYRNLSYQQQITYDVIQKYYSDAILGAQYYYNQEVLGPISGVHIQLPVLIEQLPVTEENELEIYFAAIENIPTYFEAIIEFEKEKYENNTFMQPQVKEMVVEQIEQMLKTDLYTIFVESFNRRIQLNQDVDIEAYTEKNNKYYEMIVVPAYNYLLEELQMIDLKGTSVYDVYDSGYYEYLLNTNVGTDMTAESLVDMIKNNQQKYWENMGNIQDKYGACLNNVFKMPSIISDSRDMLKILENKISKDFYDLDKDIQYRVETIPEEMQGMMTDAYYISSTKDAGSIYLNDKEVDIFLFSTVAHEGFPGHLYQANFSEKMINNKLRRYLSYDGFTEGWGTYAEMLSFKYYSADDMLVSYLTDMKLLDLSIYAMIDLGVNYLKWTEVEVADYLSSYTEVNDDVVREMMAIVKGEPTYYLTYYIGYVEIMNILEEECKEEAFEYKKFHHDLLSIGSTHFDIVKKYMSY